MSTTRTSARAIACATAAILLGGALTGCSITREDSSEPQSATASEPSPSETPTDPTTAATETPSETPSATSSATETASADDTATTEATASAPVNPQDALLSAAQLPRLNRTSPWTQRSNGVAKARAFGLCQRFDLLSIGAMSAYERTFTSRRDSAAELIAEFPDAQNAVRATKVLEAWHHQCAGQVSGRKVRVRPLDAVTVTHGKGWTYLVSYERGGRGHFHSLGMVLSGTRIALVRFDHEGEDHNYAPGKEPTELAVKAASAKLG